LKVAMKARKEIKCVVWDLDNTIWEGILLENDNVRLRPGIIQVIETLDARGILHSIASKNNRDFALEKLREFGIADYFLYPEISWNAKSVSIERIRKNLNLGKDRLLFIDDQRFERDEVNFVHPEVLCLGAEDYMKLPEHPLLNPRFITQDSRRRRIMYLDDQKRKHAESEFIGPRTDYLASLELVLTINNAEEIDLQRAEELTMRTNQLNTTGKTYGYGELKRMIDSDRHMILIGELIDKYGSFGKIGLASIEKFDVLWNLRLFLMSCRVMAYGIGSVFLTYILQKAKEEGNKVTAEFIHTDFNRMMYITLKFSNFTEIGSGPGGNVIFENDLSLIQKIPHYIKLRAG